MQQLLDFIGNHPYLSVAWVAVLAMLIHSFIKGAGGIKLISTHEATLLMNKDNAVAIDIRNEADFKKGHILGARHISIEKIKANEVAELEKQKQVPIIVVCTTGTTAQSAAAMLKKQGFEALHILKGGMSEWQNAKLPTVKA